MCVCGKGIKERRANNARRPICGGITIKTPYRLPYGKKYIFTTSRERKEGKTQAMSGRQARPDRKAKHPSRMPRLASPRLTSRPSLSPSRPTPPPCRRFYVFTTTTLPTHTHPPVCVKNTDVHNHTINAQSF